jgi:hypothetical protein
VEFVSGGPVLPSTYTSTNLASWTEQGDTNAQSFAGTARYATTFDWPSATNSATWRLSLGIVAQSARVRLNGRELGTWLQPPFALPVDDLRAQGNTLEVEVTSTSANRIRDLDRRGVVWQKFNDINFVNKGYKKFNAADWPLAQAGLLGPVTLTPLTVKP